MLDLPLSGIFDWEYKTNDSALILKWTAIRTPKNKGRERETEKLEPLWWKLEAKFSVCPHIPMGWIGFAPLQWSCGIILHISGTYREKEVLFASFLSSFKDDSHN